MVNVLKKSFSSHIVSGERFLLCTCSLTTLYHVQDAPRGKSNFRFRKKHFATAQTKKNKIHDVLKKIEFLKAP